MAVSMIGPKFYAWDRNGNPLAFGKLYTYQARTNTPKPTYQSEDQVVENTNPVILNGEGYADVYLSGSYKMVLKDDKDNEIWSSDPVTAATAEEWNNCMPAEYVAPNQFKVAGNFTNIFDTGRSVRLAQGGSDYDYTKVEESSYAGDFTIVTTRQAIVTVSIDEACTSIVGEDSVQLGNSTVVATGSTEPRTLSDRFGDVVNVKDFGAKGDGVTNDSTAIQSAIEAGSKVVFPEGVYILDGPVSATKDRLSMKAEGDVVIKINGGDQTGGGNFDSGTNAFTLNVSGEFQMEGFVFDANGTWVYRCIDLIGANGIVVDKCHWKNFRYPSLDYLVDNLSSGIRFNTCSNYTIQNCTFRDMFYKDYLGNVLSNATVTNGEKLGRSIGNGATGENANFLNNYFYETRTSVVLTHNNATFRGNVWDVWSDNAIYDLGTEGMKVIGNTFTNSPDEAIVTSGFNKFIANNNFYDVDNKVIAFNGNCDRYVITGNTFRSQNGELNAIVTRRERLTDTTRSNIIISSNVFIASKFGFSVIYMGATNQIEITDNTFEFETVFSSASQYVILLSAGSNPLFTIMNNSVQSLGAVTDLRFANFGAPAFYYANVSNINLLTNGTINDNLYDLLTSRAPRTDWAGVLTSSEQRGHLHLFNPDNAFRNKLANGAFVTAESDANDFSGLGYALMGAFGLEYENSLNGDVNTAFVAYLADDGTKSLKKSFSFTHNGELEIYSNGIGIVARSPDGTRYRLTAPNGGGAATWVAA